MYEFNYFKVKDVMTQDPVTVSMDATFADVEKIFSERDFNGIPVIDNYNNLIGLITKYDLLKAFTKRMKNPYYEVIKLQKVSSIMITNPIVFMPEEPLTRVIKKIIETGYKSFPVIHNNKVVGMVSREDIIQAIDQSIAGKLPTRLQSFDFNKLPDNIYEPEQLNFIIVSHL